MKRFALIVAVVLGLTLVGSSQAHASWGSCNYSGYQPWYNVFAKRNKCMSPEEERLQKFWHDYYHALKCYYGALDNIDWVAYYKNHGYQINANCGYPCGRINYAPVVVNPSMQWAIPNNALSGPPVGPGGMPGGMPGCVPTGMMPMGPGGY